VNPGPVPYSTNIVVKFWWKAGARLIGDTIYLVAVQERLERYGMYSNNGVYWDSGWTDGAAGQFYYEHGAIVDVKNSGNTNLLPSQNTYDEFFQTNRIVVGDGCGGSKIFTPERWQFQRKRTGGGNWTLILVGIG
jgi:hypothetical protein